MKCAKTYKKLDNGSSGYELPEGSNGSRIDNNVIPRLAM
jgi:hypothetical protein